jgi:G:T-mismatch repair DNA endonuclease (very short patch repair protein)
MKYDENKENFDNSLDSFKKIYGEVEGVIKYKDRIEKISKNNAKNKFPCTLENFIKRYGDKIGTEKYKTRCEKISYTSSKDYFIKKYGNDIGNEIWKNKYKTTKTSKKSEQISTILDNLEIKYEIEKNINSKFVDYYLTEYKMVIEYYGDYWHGNPKKYKHDYYISQLKMTASEVWEKDKNRIDKLKDSVNSIIIIWESTELNDSLLEKYINDFKDKKTTIYL